MTPLDRFVAGLRARHGRVPSPDPLDGGASARLLLLLETPGPALARTDADHGTVSRDNPTGTGRNLRRFLDGAGIARGETLIWNAVPWVIHLPGARNRAPKRAEVRAGLLELPPLLDLLPRLEAAVLAGRVAGEAGPVLAASRPSLPVFAMPHPSPTIVCTSPRVAERIEAALGEAAGVLRERSQARRCPGAVRPGTQGHQAGQRYPTSRRRSPPSTISPSATRSPPRRS